MSHTYADASLNIGGTGVFALEAIKHNGKKQMPNVQMINLTHDGQYTFLQIPSNMMDIYVSL